LTITNYSRTGREISLPECIVIRPRIFIDGELWCGRQLFDVISTLLEGNSDPWFTIRFLHFSLHSHLILTIKKYRLICFDVPSKELQCIFFEERYKCILKNVESTDPFCVS
jgi:hypothetical protein